MNEPTLQVSMPFVQPGGTFTSTGNAFKPGETVTFSLLGANVATATVGTTGNVPQTTINVPSCVFTQAKPCTSDFGPATLTATGGSSGKVSTATVDITNEWSQGGFGATRPNFEPYDSKIASDIDVGLNTILSLAWKYGTGAAVNASPIVVNGVVYVGNDNGVMSAVGTTSGAPLWTYTTPSGAPIRSSAAIDAAGNVVFGSNDGNLYEVSPSGGLVRTVALSGQLGSPAFAGNQIIVPSSNGNLYDVNDATGALTWTYTLGGAATAPAFDIANNLVVVGDSTGAITAIAGGTGTKQWSYTTGGAAAPPGIDGLGHVDVGSADGNMYQLKEITGGLIWKYAAGAAIQSASAVTASGGIQFGTANGTIILLKPTGKLLLQQEGSKYNNSPIVGIGGVNLNTFVETSSGLIGDTRNDANTPLFAWGYQTGAGFSSSPVVLDGAIYAGAGDGYLYTFTPHGSAPLESAHRAPAIAVTDGPANQWECAANE
jgi:outer membrane protein assembly factor BamB